MNETRARAPTEPELELDVTGITPCACEPCQRRAALATLAEQELKVTTIHEPKATLHAWTCVIAIDGKAVITHGESEEDAVLGGLRELGLR